MIHGFHILLEFHIEIGDAEQLLYTVNFPVSCFPGSGSISQVQQQIHKMLGEVLGGINCVRVAITTPYFYTVGK